MYDISSLSEVRVARAGWKGNEKKDRPRAVLLIANLLLNV